MTRLREICVDVSVLLWLDKFLEAKEVCELRNPQLFLFLYTTFFFGFKPKFRFKPKSFRFKQKSFRFEPKSFRFKQKCCASLACSSLFPLLAAHCFTCLHPTASLACAPLLHFQLSGNFWLVSFKISYLCLPLFHETRTTPSCHPSGCAYRQL